MYIEAQSEICQAKLRAEAAEIETGAELLKLNAVCCFEDISIIIEL